MQFVCNPKSFFPCHYAKSLVTLKIVLLQRSKRFPGEHALKVVLWENSEPADIGKSVIS